MINLKQSQIATEAGQQRMSKMISQQSPLCCAMVCITKKQTGHYQENSINLNFSRPTRPLVVAHSGNASNGKCDSVSTHSTYGRSFNTRQ